MIMYLIVITGRSQAVMVHIQHMGFIAANNTRISAEHQVQCWSWSMPIEQFLHNCWPELQSFLEVLEALLSFACFYSSMLSRNLHLLSFPLKCFLFVVRLNCRLFIAADITEYFWIIKILITCQFSLSKLLQRRVFGYLTLVCLYKQFSEPNLRITDKICTAQSLLKSLSVLLLCSSYNTLTAFLFHQILFTSCCNLGVLGKNYQFIRDQNTRKDIFAHVKLIQT